MQKQVFTTGEAAKVCQVAPRTVAMWFDRGKIRGYRISGTRDRRIPRPELVRFLADNNFAGVDGSTPRNDALATCSAAIDRVFPPVDDESAEDDTTRIDRQEGTS